jgi:hypothetical protein
MKHSVHERPVDRQIAPAYDELYREPLRAARAIIISFWLMIVVWAIIFAAWWKVAHHHAPKKLARTATHSEIRQPPLIPIQLK